MIKILHLEDNDKACIFAFLFVVIGILCISVTTFLVPPYQNPDEPNHFLRAEQISRFGLLAERLPSGNAGGISDIGIVRTADIFRSIALHPDVKVTNKMYATARSIGWGHGTYQAAFPNTSLYPPVFYLPAAAGIAVGKVMHLSIIQSMYVARFATGVMTTIIAAAAILLSGTAATWLFAVLSLPMALGLFAAVSQDGPLIATTALAVAILNRSARSDEPMPTYRFVTLCVALSLMSASRPPYLPLTLTVLFLPRVSNLWRGLGCAVIIAVAAAWTISATNIGGIAAAQLSPSISPGAQLRFLVQHPFGFIHVVFNTTVISGRDYLDEIIGQLGSLDVALPRLFHVFAWTILGVASVSTISVRSSFDTEAKRRMASVLVLISASVLLIFTAEYLTWTPVAASQIEGVQGRYFLPPLLFLVLGFPLSNSINAIWPVSASLIVSIFPFTSVAVMIRMITIRYYLN